MSTRQLETPVTPISAAHTTTTKDRKRREKRKIHTANNKQFQERLEQEWHIHCDVHKATWDTSHLHLFSKPLRQKANQQTNQAACGPTLQQGPLSLICGGWVGPGFAWMEMSASSFPCPQMSWLLMRCDCQSLACAPCQGWSSALSPHHQSMVGGLAPPPSSSASAANMHLWMRADAPAANLRCNQTIDTRKINNKNKNSSSKDNIYSVLSFTLSVSTKYITFSAQLHLHPSLISTPPYPFSINPDITLCGWLVSKHQLTNQPPWVWTINVWVQTKKRNTHAQPNQMNHHLKP